MTAPPLTTAPISHYDSSVSPPAVAGSPDRSVAARFGLRFLFAYFAFYTFPGVFGAVPGIGMLFRWWHPLWAGVAVWTGTHLLGVTRPMPIQPTGSGDTMVAYVLLVVGVAVGVIVAALWTFLDRRKDNDGRIMQLMVAYLRFTLAFILFVYGFSKVYQAQMPPLSPDRLVETLGEMSPMGLVWTFMAYSKPYNFFAGLAEAGSGFLLCFRRTTTLGALSSIAAMANVVALNFMYDVPVKLYSAHLLLMAVVIALPDAKRMLDVLILNRPTQARIQGPLWSSRRVQRVMTVLTAAAVAFTMWQNVVRSRQREIDAFAAPTRSAFWGVYDITRLERNGKDVPLLVTDAGTWRRVVFSSFNRMQIRLMADSVIRFVYRNDSTAKVLSLPARTGADSSRFAYSYPDASHLQLAGRFRGDSIVMMLKRSDRQYLLTSRGYNWVQELPFNR
jgi:hypothetical protein